MLPPPSVGTCGQPNAATWADVFLPYVKNVKVFDCPSQGERISI